MGSTNESRPTYRVGRLIVDGRAYEVLRSGARVPLTPTQFQVFYQIVERQGGVIARCEFKPWNREVLKGDRHPVDIQIVEIRNLLEDGQTNSIIETVRGRGYRVSPTVEIINSPSLSDFDRRLTIALDQLNTYTSAGFHASIKNCEELLNLARKADAASAIALAYINLGTTGFCRENCHISIKKARDVLAVALEWFPDLGSAYALMGLTYLIHEYDWDTANTNFVKALHYSPENGLAHCFLAHMRVARGSFEAAVVHARIAANVDYRNPIVVMTEPWMLLFAGLTEEAVIEGEKVIHRFGSCAPARTVLGDAYCAAGEMNKALEQYDRALEIEFLPHAVSCRGFVYGHLGRDHDALQSLAELQEKRNVGTIAYVSSWHEALVRAGLGQTKQAIDALERAFEEKCDWLIHAGVDPRWKELRGEKRFQDLLQRIGIMQLNKAL